MFTKNQIQSAQEAVAAACAKEGTTISWTATGGPYVDMNTRTIFRAPLPDNLSADALLMVRGDVDHEVAHLIYTEGDCLKALKSYYETGKATGRYGKELRKADFPKHLIPFLKEAINALEDGRINYRHGKRYLGVKANIVESRNLMFDSKPEAYTQGPALARALICLLLETEGYDRSYGLRIVGDTGDVTEKLDQVKAHVGHLHKELSEATTFEVFKKALMLTQVWAEQSEDEQQQQQQQQQQSGGDSQKETGEKKQDEQPDNDGAGADEQDDDRKDDKSSGGSKQAGNEDEQEQGKPADSDSQDSDGNSQGDSEDDGDSEEDSQSDEEGEDESGSQKPSQGSSGDAQGSSSSDANQESKKASGGATGHSNASKSQGKSCGQEGAVEGKTDASNNELVAAADFYADKLDVGNLLKSGVEVEVDKAVADPNAYYTYTAGDNLKKLRPSEWYEAEYQTLLKEVRGQIGTLRQKLFVDLQAQDARWSDNLRSGSLNERALATLATGNRNVFRRRLPEKEINTAVSLLVDCSGSMHGVKLRKAFQVAAAFAEALDVLNVPCWIGGFTTGGSMGVDDPTRYSRYASLEHLLVKDWDDNYRKQKTTVCQAMRVYGLTNADGESILWAAGELSKRPEKRKILIVLSDGQPSCGGKPGVFVAHLKAVVKRLPKAGIEVLGIGIESEAVKDYYPEYVVLHDVELLATTIYEKLRAKLRKTARSF